ncbi:phage tail protein [Maritalea sp.]|uniref:phage tail protein n=1 Tax=Maritalea sp. TaxID=2003361 RepID=UPI003EF5EB64
MFKLLLLSFCLVIGLTGPVSAAPLVGALFGTAFAGTLPGVLLGYGLTAGASFLFNQVFSPRQDAANENQKDPTQVSFGERVSRNGIIGRVLIGGHRTHYNEFDNAKKAQHVFVFADHWCDGLESIYVNGRQHDLLPVAGPYTNNEAARYQVAEYGALIDIRFHDGRPGQLADTELVAQTPGWDANRKFAGQAYVAITITSDKEKFNGEPSFKFVVRGARFYNPRKDATVGGVGTHRFDDPTTWEYSANCGVAANHFARGFYHNGRRMLGAQLGPADLDFDSNIAAMNICDEQVQRPDGSWRNRYEAHMVWLDTDQPAKVLQTICQAMGKKFAEKQGRIGFYAAKAKTVVQTITDGDLVDDATVLYSPKKAGALLFSGVQGTYTHSTDFAPAPYKAVEPTSFVTVDGRSVVQPFDLPQVQDAHQAYLLVKQYLFRSRLQATARITLDIKDLILEIGDWIVWESSHALRGTKTYEIVATKLDLNNFRIQLDLAEIDAAAFADDATPDQVIELPRSRPFSGYQKEVFGFAVGVGATSGANGEVLPVLEFSYSAITDPAIRALKFEYRIVGDTQIFKAIDNSVGDGSYYVTNGVMPGQTYEARARLDSLPGRETVWTNWIPIDVPTGPMVVTIQPEQIDYSHLARDLGNAVGVLNGTGVGSLSAAIAGQNDEIERLANAQANGEGNAYISRKLISKQTADTAAAVLVEQQVRADNDAALAQSIIEANVAMGDAFANGLFKVDAVVNGDGSEAIITLKARAGDQLGFVDTGIRIIAKSNGTSQIVMVANQMLMMRQDGSTHALFGVGQKFDIAHIPTITADKMQVTQLSAITSDIGDATAGSLTLNNGKFRIENSGRLVISD